MYAQVASHLESALQEVAVPDPEPEPIPEEEQPATPEAPAAAAAEAEAAPASPAKDAATPVKAALMPVIDLLSFDDDPPGGRRGGCGAPAREGPVLPVR